MKRIERKSEIGPTLFASVNSKIGILYNIHLALPISPFGKSTLFTSLTSAI